MSLAPGTDSLQVVEHYSRIRSLAEQVHQIFTQQLNKIGFDLAEVSLQHPDKASYRIVSDVVSDDVVLSGTWKNAHGEKTGSLLFYPNGQFYIEQDVIKRHPFRNDCFIEAMNAWGKPDKIKAEPRFMGVGQ